MLWRLRDRQDPRPGILTRLDKDTSGLVVIGLLADVHAAMQRDAFAGRVRKEYLAIVHGVPDPPRGTIALPLARDPADRRRVIATSGGAASETRYDLIASRHGMSALRCELVTGRTHQIRVHLAASGWPIVGDRVYGAAADCVSGTPSAGPTAGVASIARQALHAWRIALPHPLTRAALTFEAPLPPDVRPLFDALTV